MTLAYPTNADLIAVLKTRDSQSPVRGAACMHLLACMHFFF